MERRIVTVMFKEMNDNMDKYPKFKKWSRRPYVTQQVKVYVNQLRKERKV
jgi:hypothetical protein